MSYRLPATVVPTRYDLRLEPDLQTGTFAGEETIAITVREPVDEIWLNAAELAIGAVARRGARRAGARRRGDAGAGDRAGPAGLPGPARARGVASHGSRFPGTLNDKLRGFYRSTLQGRRRADAHAGGHPVRGRRTPGARSRAGTSRRARPSSRSPSSCPTATRRSPTPGRPEERRRARPARRCASPTPCRMSTYLVAFVVGRAGGDRAGRWSARRRSASVCVPGKLRLTRLRARDRRVLAALLRGVLRPALSRRQARPARDPGLRRRARWRTSAPSRSGRPRCWWTSRRPRTWSWSGSPTWSPTRSPTCGSATW